MRRGSLHTHVCIAGAAQRCMRFAVRIQVPMELLYISNEHTLFTGCEDLQAIRVHTASQPPDALPHFRLCPLTCIWAELPFVLPPLGPGGACTGSAVVGSVVAMPARLQHGNGRSFQSGPASHTVKQAWMANTRQPSIP